MQCSLWIANKKSPFGVQPLPYHGPDTREILTVAVLTHHVNELTLTCVTSAFLLVFNLYSLNIVSFFHSYWKNKNSPSRLYHTCHIQMFFDTPSTVQCWLLCGLCGVVQLTVYSALYCTVTMITLNSCEEKLYSNFTCILFGACRYQCKNYFHDFCLPVSVPLVVF